MMKTKTAEPRTGAGCPQNAAEAHKHAKHTKKQAGLSFTAESLIPPGELGGIGGNWGELR
jgi:hypothetical protein